MSHAAGFMKRYTVSVLSIPFTSCSSGLWEISIAAAATSRNQRTLVAEYRLVLYGTCGQITYTSTVWTHVRSSYAAKDDMMLWFQTAYTLLSCCNYLLYKLPWSQVVLLKTSLTCTLQTQKGNKKALSRGSNVVHLLWPWTIYDLWPRTSKSNLTKTVSRCIKLACQISQSETILFKSWVMTHIHVKTPDQLPDPVSMTWTKDRNY